MSTHCIIRKENRETITFSDKPTAETCRHLRSVGFDYDRRNGYWYRTDVIGSHLEESAITEQVKA